MKPRVYLIIYLWIAPQKFVSIISVVLVIVLNHQFRYWFWNPDLDVFFQENLTVIAEK